MSVGERPDRTNDAQQPPEFLAVGRISRPHGVQGALLVESDSDLIYAISPGSKVYLGTGHTPLTVRRFNPHRKQYLLHVEEIRSRDEADQFRDQVLWLYFDDVETLPQGVYYHWQLIGMQVVSEDDEDLGVLEQIIVTGANDVYLVRERTGDELLLPAIQSVIKHVDLQERKMTVHLLPGLR
jgi:16S rRNA processing protein RimM